jgi:2-keto-4-pentenoate hydratase
MTTTPVPVDIENAASELRQARESRKPCEPVYDRFNIRTIEDAYAVQASNTAAWVRQGRKIVGRKVGLTSTAVQRQQGVDQPDFGTLFADMGYPNNAVVCSYSLIQPKAEGEIAMVMKRDCGEPNMPLERLADHVAYVMPAIEVVDSAVADWRITIFDTIADNASSGVYVLGDARKSITEVDLLNCEMVMEKNGEVVSTGRSADCLGHPLNALRWLVDVRISLGEPIRAGELILTGALGRMAPVAPRDRIEVDISDLGRVGMRMS